MRARSAIALAAGCAAGLIWVGLDGSTSTPGATAPAAPAPSASTDAAGGGEGRPLRAPAAGPAATAAHEHEGTPPDDPTGDLAYYDAYPMSRIPHRVVRGWGLGPGSSSLGHVGAFVVVDPSISVEALERLARDIQRYHEGADAVSVRIVDLERAATYDRHEDGGALREQHLVGRVQRNARLELDEIVLRGQALDPGA